MRNLIGNIVRGGWPRFVLAILGGVATAQLVACASATPLEDIDAAVAEQPLPPDVREPPRVDPTPPEAMPPSPAEQPLAIPRPDAPLSPQPPPPAGEVPPEVRAPMVGDPRGDPLVFDMITDRIRHDESIDRRREEVIDLLTIRIGERRFVTPPISPEALRAVLEPPPYEGLPQRYDFIDRYGRPATATMIRERDAGGETFGWSVEYDR